MKLKTLLAALFVAGLAVSVAVAAPADKGRNGKASTPVETTSATDVGLDDDRRTWQRQVEGQEGRL